MSYETVVLTGASGLLGTWLRRSAPAGTEVVSVTHRRRVDDCPEVVADLRDCDAVGAALANVQPSLVIHAAFARDEASIVTATENVVEAAHRVNADLLYISSEAVFSGDGAPREETATPDPVWDYGRWKAQAEQTVAQSMGYPATIRLPLIISVDPEDHIIADIRAGADSGQPTVWFEDEMRAPALAEELASAIWQIAALTGSERAGVWHLGGAESLSRYEIAERAVAVLGLGGDVITAVPTPFDAQRPRDLKLRDDRARRQIGWVPSRVLIGPTPRTSAPPNRRR